VSHPLHPDNIAKELEQPTQDEPVTKAKYEELLGKKDEDYKAELARLKEGWKQRTNQLTDVVRECSTVFCLRLLPHLHWCLTHHYDDDMTVRSLFNLICPP